MKKVKISKTKVKNNTSKNGKSIILSCILIAGIAVISIILIFALYIIISSPDFDKEKLYSKEATVLYYKDGVTELARVGSNGNRVLVTYDELPQVLIDALIAPEDSRFFQHSGLDVARFLKASVGQLMGKKWAGGASTLTMQLVKNNFTGSEDEGLKGIIRKFTDIYMAVFKIESNYTKEEIIEFYVNSQWLGGDGSINYNGIWGVEQACQHYFGKSVSDISLAEATIIAGMFQNASINNPYTSPTKTRKRQNTVLTLMVQHGYITEEEKEAVLDIPIESLLKERNTNDSSSNQAVIDYVLNEVEANTNIDPRKTPMKIITTIDPNVQEVLNKLEKEEIYTFPNEALQEGIAITSTTDGSIVALSGGRNYVARGTNRATKIRQPGSTAKILFDYGPYIEYLNGSPATLFLDEPTTYSNGTPINNSDRKYMGLITMRSALINSRNIPALEAFKTVYAENPSYITNFVESLGINYGGELYESASIGGFDGISPIQMSAAYAAFGRGGYYIKPYSYTKITLSETGEELEYKYEKEKVMSEETAYMITDILVSAAESGVGGVSVSGTQIAAKSGTTNVDSSTIKNLGIEAGATRDAWNITYSPEYSIALWIGYDKTTAENYLTVNLGNKVRAAVMKAIGSRIYSKNKTFDKPSSVISVEIEKETFPTQLASEFTPNELRSIEIFKEGTEPTEVSTRFAKLNAPSGGNYTFDGTTIKLSWSGITIPDAISSNYLQNYFNTYYGNSASKYYEQRIAYNNSYIGTLGYQVYKKESDGSLTYLGRTENTNYTINNPASGKTTYIIKSAYSIFQSNMSNGLEITTNANIDSNVDNIISTPEKPTTPTNPNTGLE